MSENRTTDFNRIMPSINTYMDVNTAFAQYQADRNAFSEDIGEKLTHSMQHRNMKNRTFIKASIDDIIERGNFQHWKELTKAILLSESIKRKTFEVCRHVMKRKPDSQKHWVFFHLCKQGRMKKPLY